MKPANHDAAPRFWRDAALPFIEARSIADGRKVCYSRHAHDHFSIGAITGGRSTYLHEQSRFQVQSGTVVLMNPGDVHACNPINDQPWSYVMLYVDTQWLRDLQRRIGFDPTLDFQAFDTTHSRDVVLYSGLCALYEVLVDEQIDADEKTGAAMAFFTDLQHRLNPAGRPDRGSHPALMRAAQFIHDHCTEALKLEDICAFAQLSPSYLSPSPIARGQVDRRRGAGERVCRPGAFPAGLQATPGGDARAVSRLIPAVGIVARGFIPAGLRSSPYEAVVRPIETGIRFSKGCCASQRG
jgi:hypothetical protein